ncbi:MAG: DUF2914 domain-containing protein [Candidatus Krumholzibacteria bacterium]|nr:DUF2914 domain-containing protein [Candidatus Krumholzibacteria bacterium]
MSRKNLPCSARVLSLVLMSALLLGGGGVWAQAEAPAEGPAPVVEVLFGTDVDRATRTIVGQSEEFGADGFSAEEGQVFCLTRIQHLAAPASVTHVWYYEGKTMARVELTVGSADWRTWSSKRVLPAWTGNWELKVLDANGMVLASAEFTVK